MAGAIVNALDAAANFPWPVGHHKVPDSGGGDPAATFTPYATVWSLNTTTTAAMSHSDANNQTPFQITCASNIPEDSALTGRASVIGQRAAQAVLDARRAGGLDTSGQKVTLGKIDVVNGPFRDSEDDRIWVCHVLLRFHTQPTST